MSPSLSVIVPATDGPPTLGRCADAIRDQTHPPEELLLIDGPAELGPAAARNLGALRATGDVVVFVDSDVLPHRDALERIRAAFRADPGLTAVFGAYDQAPESEGHVSTFRNLLHHHVHAASAGPRQTFWSGLGAVRRDTFLAAGGFDSARFHGAYIEDIELGMRLAERRERIVLDPEIRGTHLKPWTVLEMVHTDLRRRGAPWVAQLLRRRRFSRELNLGRRHRISAAATLVGAGALVSRRPAIAAGAIGVNAALNAKLYALCWRRGGAPGALAGIGLHALHHLTGVLALPLGAVSWARHARAGHPEPAESLEALRQTAAGVAGGPEAPRFPRSTAAAVVT